MNEFVPIALMKIEGQLGHQNAILAAELELNVLTLKHDGDVPKDVLGTFFSQYIDTRKQIDEYVSGNLANAMETAQDEEADDAISKMNLEKEKANGHEA